MGLRPLTQAALHVSATLLASKRLDTIHAILINAGRAATYKGQNLFDMEPEDRARSGLFMSFQSPVEVPGVSNAEFLRMAANARRTAQGQPELDPLEFYGFITPKVAAIVHRIAVMFDLLQAAPMAAWPGQLV